MTITREQVAYLRGGDIVEVTGYSILKGATIRGALRAGDGQTLSVGPLILRRADGSPVVQHDWDDDLTLTVVSRALRPLYVNHPRTEPVPGDVVRIDFDEPYDDDSCVNVFLPDRARPHDPWLSIRHDEGMRYSSEQVLPGPTTKGRAVLLVDGETGQVVPS